MLTYGEVGLLRDLDKNVHYGGFFAWRAESTYNNTPFYFAKMYWCNAPIPSLVRAHFYKRRGKKVAALVTHVKPQNVADKPPLETLIQQPLLLELVEVLEVDLDAIDNKKITLHVV